MTKLSLMIKGYFSCLSWIPGAIWQILLNELPELKFWKKHDNFNDHIWYAERVNGRIAMLAITFLIVWSATHGIKLNEILF